MSRVRSKFKVTSVSDPNASASDVTLSAVAGERTSPPSGPVRPGAPARPDEGESFARATGEITMHVDNPGALKQFTMGKEFYVDFTPA